MKRRLAIIVAACLVCSQAIAGNYILKIDDKQHEVDLEKQITIKLPDGREILVTLDKKAIVSFRTKKFSFDYPGRLAPVRSDIGNSVFQTMMVTPFGTAILIQEYLSMNPCSFIEALLSEFTKEEVEYGYNIVKNSSERKLPNGVKLEGKMAISEYKDVQYTRHFLCHSERDEGIIIITQIEKSAPQEDVKMLEKFWESLEILTEKN